MNLVTANIVFELIEKGGPIMWPLLFCVFAAVCIALERGLFWLRLSRKCSSDQLSPSFEALATGKFEEAEEISSKSVNPLQQMLNAGIHNAHSSLLGSMQMKAAKMLNNGEKRMWILNTLITLAPLLGLMGTVIGIMDSFNFAGDSELAVSKVSGGIGEALIATACGLGVAIAALIPFNFFKRCQHSLRNRLEETINTIELFTTDAKNHGFDLDAFSRSLKLEGKEFKHAG